jgi:hypothetical protein
MTDIETALTDSVDKDGQTVITGNIDFNGNQIILDTDGDTSIHADTDDQIDFEIGGSDVMVATAARLAHTGTFEPAGDTAAGDNAAFGYTAAEGAIITGQGTTNDVTIKNDADEDVAVVPTGLQQLKLVQEDIVATPTLGFGDGDTGLYESADDTLHIATAGAIALSFSAAGEITKPLQPAFLAFNSSNDNNVTGNGTVATVDFDTEVFDQGGDFASDTFTAPVTGRYRLTAQVRFSGVNAGTADDIEIIIVTSNRSYSHKITSSNNIQSQPIMSFSVLADMDAADTATVTAEVNGEASDVVDISGNASEIRTFFCGELVA